MNAFAAAAILSQISLHDFLALRADERLQLPLPIPASMMVGTIISFHIINDRCYCKEQFNTVIVQRREDVDTLIEDEDGVY